MVDDNISSSQDISYRVGSGDRIYRWMVKEQIAEGAFKRVYRVEPVFSGGDDITSRVMKIFKAPDEITSHASKRNLTYLNESRVKKFEHEVKSLTDAEGHPNIATIEDWGFYAIGEDPEKSGLIYLVEEYVEGPTLREFLDRHREGETRTEEFYNSTLNIFHQLSKALYYLHGKLEMAHLDVKADNVLLRPASADEGSTKHSVVLTDFGNATLIGDEEYYQEGSILYRAPEQLQRKKRRSSKRRGGRRKARPSAGAPADVWAFGVLLYEFLTGKYPFETSTPDWSELEDEALVDAKEKLKRNILQRNISIDHSGFPPYVSRTLIELPGRILNKRPPEQRPIMKNIYHSLSRIVGSRRP